MQKGLKRGPFLFVSDVDRLLSETLYIGGRIFAATIDFDVECQTVILSHLANTRPLKRGNVHEHIFAAIVTLDETKSLHVIEELHGAIGAFASRFAHRPTLEPGVAITTAALEATTVAAAITIEAAAFGTRSALWNRKRIAIDHEVGSRNLAAAINKREFERLSFGQTGQTGLLDGADVHEYVIGAIIDLNETETLLIIEEFDNTLAFANHLGGHCRATGSTAAEATAAAGTAAETTATTATGSAKTAAAGAFTGTQFARE
jgi:hypothetical protein